MPALKPHEDAYGRAFDDYHHGRRGVLPITERDDGMVDVGAGVPGFFEESWSVPDRQAFRHLTGRVLDVGAGAGRVTLHLQKKGIDVVAIDDSPLTVKVLKARGAKNAHAIPFSEIDERVGKFDSIAMWG